ncbi:MAG: helix-turn-helix domain-containing protein [Terricaulis sp.]
MPQPDLFGEATQLSQASRQPSLRAQPALPRARASSRTTSRIVSPPPVLLNVREAAARLGLSKSTLDKWRCAGKGPRYVKSTDRAVRYDPEDLDAWIAARKTR